MRGRPPVRSGSLRAARGGAPRAAALALGAATLVATAPALAAEDPEKTTMGTALLVVAVDLEIAGRSLSYSDLVSQNLRDYDVFGVPMPSARIEVYPLAKNEMPFVSDLGVVVSAAHAFGLDSEAADGTDVSTTWDRLYGGLRYRIRLTDDAQTVLGISAGVRWSGFNFDTSGDLAGQVASASYVAMRVGLDLRFPVGPLAIEAGAGYQEPFSTGDLGNLFRDPSVGGLDFNAVVAIPLSDGFELRAGGNYTRYFYSFEAQPGDEYIAGGALDQYFSVSAGAVFFF